MPDAAPSASRSTTPGSPSRSSLYDATNAIDDLTRSFANFSRVATPEPPGEDHTCSGRDDCDYTKAWLAVKSKLESRLVLSAEVGQALLQRHEAYVRRTQRDRDHRHQPSVDELEELLKDDPRTRMELETRVAELVRENAMLEKRFNQALLNSEVSEASNKTLVAELQDVRLTVSRQSAELAKSVGWESRLRRVMQETDDMHQERDEAVLRARAAESRLIALGDKCAKLRVQIRQLQDSLNEQHRHRSELSEDILHDARARLEELQHSQYGPSSGIPSDEVTKILENLVADNEALKQSNTELQDMLADSREELRALQEEAEEYRASSSFSYNIDDTFRSSRPPSRMVPNMTSSRMTYGTAPGPISPISSAFSHRGPHHNRKRSASTEAISRLDMEPLTPQTNLRSLSPDSYTVPETINVLSAPDQESAANTMAGDVESSRTPVFRPPWMGKDESHRIPSQRASRAVQTDPWPGVFPTFTDFSSLSMSPRDGRSESSSLIDNPSTLSVLLDRVAHLLNRMAQADALTLMTRLKRQNIAGADVSYLSRTTVDSILLEVANLRLIFRGALEDDKFTTACNRKDLRAMLKVFRDLFRELGALRATLNDIVLDPSLAPKVRDMVFNPEADLEQKETKSTSIASGPGWMAPFSKLFGVTSPEPARSSSSMAPLARPISRPIPKVAAAPSASTTTVNVEFTGTGAGRAITDSLPRWSPTRGPAAGKGIPAPTPHRQVSQSVMGIFAGAPRADPDADPWVVIKAASKLKPKPSVGQLRTRSVSRSAGKRLTNEPSPLSRNVDAVIDLASPVEPQDAFDASLLERTLRPRGLSDSSIRSTYLQHAEDPPVQRQQEVGPSTRQGVFQALSQKVSVLRLATLPSTGGSTMSESIPSPPGPVSTSLGHRRVPSNSDGTLPRAISPRLARLMPDLSWAAAGGSMDTEGDRHMGTLPRQDTLYRESRGREMPW
ncbi:hypothetical protein OF83DRAFT_1169499 [Amylostereum chailletii]|nr:hypothetical protein OF83DRAFT_1169499 [Amylostereum chailletii]